jgi:hypothetical protein
MCQKILFSPIFCAMLKSFFLFFFNFQKILKYISVFTSKLDKWYHFMFFPKQYILSLIFVRIFGLRLFFFYLNLEEIFYFVFYNLCCKLKFFYWEIMALDQPSPCSIFVTEFPFPADVIVTGTVAFYFFYFSIWTLSMIEVFFHLWVCFSPKTLFFVPPHQ